MEGAAPSPSPQFNLLPSRQFPNWLAEHGLSLAFTTYQAGKIVFVGLQPNGRLSIFERTFNRCMGLWADPGGQTLWMSTLYQLWRLENALPPGETRGATEDGYDRLYVPQAAYTTGDIDVHDLSIDAVGRPVFVNTLFSCLATVSEAKSFRPLWQPPFISKLMPEDRCHLNGLAMRDGAPAYVTAAGDSDVADGWRERRLNGGVAIDVWSGAIVGRGFTMPHSPRCHDDKLYVLDSGTGRFGVLNPNDGAFEEVAFCPGYLRGLAFHRGFAIVGVSEPRDNTTFSGLPLEEALARRRADPICALLVIDLTSGAILHWLKIEGLVSELYDVVALPGVRRPQAVGLKTDEIRRILTLES